MLTAYVWLLVVLALVAANLPWLSDRILFVITPKGGRKHFGWRLLEEVIMYLVVGALALGLEYRATGALHAQTWEFYTITFFLFLVFALPGFVYRFDLKPHLARRRR